ncbi:hypothetical protein BT67DRAFT_185413 [Trichocladium antarcticum]|uniref:Uncharacterized protein n=1 Tax=Trichocladium antarcticum TaxID=1450529 RepID=A0AAN6UPL7_9PEZI|nr:hypothetical protein BT67DRAFT_185413 [Trichocladium antarcticum]
MYVSEQWAEAIKNKAPWQHQEDMDGIYIGGGLGTHKIPHSGRVRIVPLTWSAGAAHQPGFVHSHSLSHLKPSLGYKTAPLHLRQHLACIRASLRWLPQNMPVNDVSQDLEFCPIPLLVPLCTSKCVSYAPCTSLSFDLPVPTCLSGILKAGTVLARP